MAFNYIVTEQSNPRSLLLTVIICMCGSGVIAQTGPDIAQDVEMLQNVNVTDNTIVVQWKAPASITEFKVSYTNGSTSEERNTTNTSYTITNLLPGVNYNITVYSLNATNTSPGVTISVTTLPSIVKGLNISTLSTNEVTVFWTKSSDTHESTYSYALNGQGPGFEKQTDLKTNSTVVPNLEPGTDYSFIVYAVTSNGVYSSASDVAHVTTLPSVVNGLMISNISIHEVTVSWKKSNDTYESTYTYIVKGQGPDTVQLSNLKPNSAVVAKLRAGSDYNFTVYAVTNNGVESPTSDVAIATTLPSVVKGLMISNISTYEVTVSWTKSNDTYESTYTYTVKGTGPDTVKLTDIKTNSTVVAELQAGSDYDFTVYALTNNGVESPTSDVAIATTRPSSVLYFAVSAVTENSVNLTWTFPTDIPVQTYTYTVENLNNRDIFTNIYENHTTILDLLPGLNYSFTIYTVTKNQVNSSAYPTINTTTMPSIVHMFMVASKTNNSVILNWTVPNNTYVDTYTYTVKMTGNFNQTLLNIKENFARVEKLAAGETYNFSIYTVTINGVQSFAYPFIMDTTMPNEPQSLSTNRTSIDEILIAWTPPGDIHASSYKYNVKWQNVHLKEDQGLNTTEDTHFNIRRLFPGNLYTITVTSEFQSTFSVNAEKNVQTNPVSTENFTVLHTTNTTAELQWNIPSYSNSQVNGYRVIVLQDGKKVYNWTTKYTNIIMDNLKPGYIYGFSVESFASNTIASEKRSLNQMDSTWISYSTPKSTKAEMVPDPVTDASCSKVDGYQMKVAFKCPFGNYSEIQVLVNNKANYNCSCNNSNVISGLQPAKGYMVKIITLGTDKRAVTDTFTCYTDSTGVIVGSVLGILIFLLLIGLIVFFVFQKRRSKSSSEDMLITSKGKRFHTISKERFRQHYENNHANSDFGFAEEYQELSSFGTTQSKRAAELPENRAKNRFTNVLPYDHSRVKLTTINETATSDYINANFIPGYNSTKEFIASQGPLPNTIVDFWRMILEHHVNTIVMLTNCTENGRVKCERYWPLDYTPCTYGDITVTVTTETILSEWTTRDFSVKYAQQPGVQYVRHFHFTAWPDHGVPDSTSSIIQFRKLVRDHMDQQRSNGPAVVHCSAGVGRTGTLIALDYLIHQMEREHRIGIYGCVEKMRMNRGLMVQTEEQYIFLNKCMLDLIEQPSEERIYENQVLTDLIYENATVVRNFQRENA